MACVALVVSCLIGCNDTTQDVPAEPNASASRDVAAALISSLDVASSESGGWPDALQEAGATSVALRDDGQRLDMEVIAERLLPETDIPTPTVEAIHDALHGYADDPELVADPGLLQVVSNRLLAGLMYAAVNPDHAADVAASLREVAARGDFDSPNGVFPRELRDAMRRYRDEIHVGRIMAEK